MENPNTQRPLCRVCGVRFAGTNKRGQFTRPCWTCRTPKEQQQNAYLRKLYGITAEQRDLLIREQNGLCAICGISPATDIDHCHVTGKVRAILCQMCNMAAGALRDNPDYAEKMLAYLRLHDIRHLSDEEIALRLQSVKRRPKGNPRISPEQKAIINNRFQDGESYRTLAEEFGIHITHVYNLLDKKPGTPVGNRHGNAKLTAEQVRQIRSRRAAGETTVALGKEFHVSAAYVTQICQRLRWKHVK